MAKLKDEWYWRKIEGYIEPENEYTLVDSNKFSKEELLEDTLMTSKAMLIEKSKIQKNYTKI